MPHLPSLLTISLFSSRQDVIYLCKKAVEPKYKVSLFSNFSQIRFSDKPINIVDSSLLILDKEMLSNPPLEFVKNAICLLAPDTPNSALVAIEENYPHTISYPPDTKLLLSYIDILMTQQKIFEINNDSHEKKIYTGPSNLKGLFSGNSTVMQKLRTDIQTAALSNTPVFLLGETGVGKTTAAQLIHDLSSRRLHKMQSVNMATIIEGLAESTLFGTKQGAYTDATNRNGLFKMADNSTLFLDEIGTASNAIQSKLLTVIETGLIKKVGSDVKEKVDVRLITSTNANILEMINEGTFRKDFYFRISDLIIEIPPLRNRKEDLEIICNDFLKDKNVTMSEEAIEKIKNYNWPGNIRELHQCLNRAVIKCTDDIITPELIDFGLFN